ncbi:MAG: hypothetical protein V7K83_08340 [Nostoc sp.]
MNSPQGMSKNGDTKSAEFRVLSGESHFFTQDSALMSLTEYRGFKSPGSITGKFWVGVCLTKLLLYSASLRDALRTRILRRGRPQDRNAALNPRHKT